MKSMLLLLNVSSWLQVAVMKGLSNKCQLGLNRDIDGINGKAKASSEKRRRTFFRKGLDQYCTMQHEKQDDLCTVVSHART